MFNIAAGNDYIMNKLLHSISTAVERHVQLVNDFADNPGKFPCQKQGHEVWRVLTPLTLERHVGHIVWVTLAGSNFSAKQNLDI